MLEDTDIKKIHLSKTVSSCENNFIGYKDDNHKIKPLRIMLSNTIGYVKSYDGEAQ